MNKVCIIAILVSTFLVVSSTQGEAELADSPWPKEGHDLQNTGRSPYVGPQENSLRWTHAGNGVTSPVIGGNGTIYFGSWDNKFYSLNPDGTLKWSFQTNARVTTSPVIGRDGTIYFGCYDNRLYALTPDGTEKWVFSTGAWINSSPTIGFGGTIYFGTQAVFSLLEGEILENGKLYALYDNGDHATLKWSFPTAGLGIRNSSPAIGTGNTIYFGSLDGNFYAVYDNGDHATLKWSYPVGDLIDSSPAIGADETIYFSAYDGKLYALYENCSLRWSFPTYGLPSAPVIGSDGTIYFGGGNFLFAVCPENGLEKWSYHVGDLIFESTPVIDASGNIYFGSLDNTFYALQDNGSLKWSYTAGGEIFSSPAIGADGTIYFGSADGKLYAIGSPLERPLPLWLATTFIVIPLLALLGAFFYYRRK